MNLTIVFLCITSSMMISFFLIPKTYESKSIIRIETQTPEGILYDRIQKSMNNLGYKENIPASSLFKYIELIKLCLRPNILSNDMDGEGKKEMQKVEIVNIKGTDMYAITVKSNKRKKEALNLYEVNLEEFLLRRKEKISD
ncbi:hypothetical protein [Anaerosinus sp.]